MSDATDEKAIAFGDIERELAVTRNVLAAIPMDKFDWKAHEKSMSIGGLALHVATLPDWASGALVADELDFATAPRPPKRLDTTAELLALFDKAADGLRNAIANFDMKKWNATWIMRNGDKIFTSQPRPKVFRIWSINHLIHHRAQLCVYLRLLNIPVPTVYFNTADDPSWVFE